MNPNNEKHMDRLERCREWSENRIQKFRDNRREFVTTYMGQHYINPDDCEIIDEFEGRVAPTNTVAIIREEQS